jgi:hypothetical protein
MQMQVFTYPLFYRLLYKYGNLPANVVLIFYLYVSATGMDNNLIYLIPLVINLVLLYFLNKHYFALYTILPYRIEADEFKITASDFILSNKKVVINYKDIAKLQGGVFDGKLTGVMKIQDGPTKQVIGFFNKIRNADKLQTIILSKVPRPVYDEVIEKIGRKKGKKD